MKPIADRAEISIDFPDKAYFGAFGRASQYEVRMDAEGAAFRLVAGEDRRAAELHLHWYLLADLLKELAEKLDTAAPDEAHADPLRDAARRLSDALKPARRRRRGDPG